MIRRAFVLTIQCLHHYVMDQPLFRRHVVLSCRFMSSSASATSLLLRLEPVLRGVLSNFFVRRSHQRTNLYKTSPYFQYVVYVVYFINRFLILSISQCIRGVRANG